MKWKACDKNIEDLAHLLIVCGVAYVVFVYRKDIESASKILYNLRLYVNGITDLKQGLWSAWSFTLDFVKQYIPKHSVTRDNVEILQLVTEGFDGIELLKNLGSLAGLFVFIQKVFVVFRYALCVFLTQSKNVAELIYSTKQFFVKHPEVRPEVILPMPPMIVPISRDLNIVAEPKIVKKTSDIDPDERKDSLMALMVQNSVTKSKQTKKKTTSTQRGKSKARNTHRGKSKPPRGKSKARGSKEPSKRLK